MNARSKSEARADRLKDRLKAVTRAAILEAAEDVFARDGITRARIDTIATRAGVSVGTIYNHIGDRDALFGAVLTLRRQEYLDGIERALDETEGEDVRVRLERLARTMLEHVDRHRGFFAIVLESAEGPRRAKPPEAVALLLEGIESVLRRGAKDGALRSELGRPEALLFAGMLRAAIRDRLADPRSPSAASWAGTIAALFVDGAAAPRRRR